MVKGGEGIVSAPITYLLDFTPDMPRLGRVIVDRIKFLLTLTRYGSFKKGEAVPVPEEAEFFEVVKKYAAVFHDLVHHHPDATNRFFGNAAFRCERGFPSFKASTKIGDEKIVFVSGRNMDKRFIDKESFVPVEMGHLPVAYYGDKKPSVDTPIQLRMYWHFKNIKYMIHSHVYVEGAPTTLRVIPCGSLEEYDDIVEVVPDEDTKFIAVNLRGHGSLVMAKNVKDLEGIKYVPMDVPNDAIGTISCETMKVETKG